MGPSRGSLYGFGSFFEGLACRTSSTRRVATLSRKPGIGPRPGRIMTAVWFGAATSVSGLRKALWNAPKRRTPGGQRRFAEVAISTTLLLGAVFRLSLRRTEGFVRTIVDLMGCALPVPDHTTLSRRRRTVDVALETGTNKRPTDVVLDSTGLKFFGAGESRAKHGETRRSWGKLHILVDPAGSEIRAHELTGDDTADATMAGTAGRRFRRDDPARVCRRRL